MPLQDMHDLAPSNRDIVERMRPLLPTAYAQGCAAAVSMAGQ